MGAAVVGVVVTASRVAGSEETEVPRTVVAVTVKVKVVPRSKLEIEQLVPVEVQVFPPGEVVTVYSVMGAEPDEMGGDQLTAAVRLTPVTTVALSLTSIGAPGRSRESFVKVPLSPAIHTLEPSVVIPCGPVFTENVEAAKLGLPALL